MKQTMNKQELQIKIADLDQKTEAQRNALGITISEAQVMRERLDEVGKPVISEDMMTDLVQQLERVFAETIENIDCDNLSPEFSLNYNEVSLDRIDLDDVGVDPTDIQDVFEQYFVVKTIEDEEGDLQDELDKASEEGDSRFKDATS